MMEAGKKYTVTIADCEADCISGEYVLYFKEQKKALILNETSSAIWEVFVSKHDCGETVTLAELEAVIRRRFYVPEGYAVGEDVREAVEKMARMGGVEIVEMKEAG